MNELLVLLGSDLDLREYRRRQMEGRTPDRVPYGADQSPGGWALHPVAGDGATRRHRRLSELAKRRLGFDLPHAWRHRRALRTAEFVYAHSEVDYLAAAAVLRALRARDVTLVGQTLWLFHEWDHHPRWRRMVMRWCLSRVDLFVANAAPNAELGRCLVPGAPHVFVPFGVSEEFTRGALSSGGDGLVLAVGNDRARDWDTFLAAVERLPEHLTLRIASGRTIAAAPPGSVRATESLDELRQLYVSAAVLVVALRTNTHASGITTVLEAAAVGCPVVATRAGGLDDYFGDDEVRFVPEGDVESLVVAIESLVGNAQERAVRGARLREAFERRGYDNRSYWVRVTDQVVDHRRARTA